MVNISYHDPSNLEKFLISLIGGRKRLSKDNVTVERQTEEVEIDPDAAVDEIKEILGRFLKPMEVDVFLRREQLGQTYDEIGRRLSINRGNAQKNFKKGKIKGRVHFTALFMHELLSKNGGCTVDPNTFERTGFVGYAVSKKDCRLSFSEVPSYQQIYDYLWEHHDQLKIGRDESDLSPLYAGGSQKPESGWMLELTYVVPVYCRAWALGILENQSTIFDFQTEENVDVLYPLRPFG